MLGEVLQNWLITRAAKRAQLARSLRLARAERQWHRHRLHYEETSGRQKIIPREALMARRRKDHSATAVVQQTAASTHAPTRPSDIVQGIKLQVTGRELVVRLTERIRWHHERADALITQMKKLFEVEREAAGELVTMLGRYESPRTLLERKLREHQERASFLIFLRDHVNVADTYRLDSTDLRMTEILPETPC
jgi:hypothetical protein